MTQEQANIMETLVVAALRDLELTREKMHRANMARG